MDRLTARPLRGRLTKALCSGLALAISVVLAGCSAPSATPEESAGSLEQSQAPIDDVMVEEAEGSLSEESPDAASSRLSSEAPRELDSASDETNSTSDAELIRDGLGIIEDYRPEFSHGEKGAAYQRYIVLHDTESDAAPATIVDYWDGADNGVAAHFVVGTDGTIVQCVPLDEIAHHAGYGDAGHNDLYGVVEDGRDDMIGTVPIGSWAPDYGMNAWSIGIEMVHVGGAGDYPEEQLEAVDSLIAYIDAYYGIESEIIDHKAWRTGNSDTSAEFTGYFANYQDHRTHD